MHTCPAPFWDVHDPRMRNAHSTWKMAIEMEEPLPDSEALRRVPITLTHVQYIEGTPLESRLASIECVVAIGMISS